MTVLAADSLSVAVDDGATILSDVSLSVAEDETVLICGPPGSGKTMLLKALVGLLADRADVVVDGEIDGDADIGYVAQHPGRQLVRRTVRFDIGFGLENRGVDPDVIARRVEQIATKFGITALLDRRVDRLSAGETTTVALLGVLVTKPDVVVLDEPFSTLDLPGIRLVLDALDTLREEGTSVVIAEHDGRDLLARADRVVCIDEGKMVAEGPPVELAPVLHRMGVKLPFRTRVAIARGEVGTHSLPLVEDAGGMGTP